MRVHQLALFSVFFLGSLCSCGRSPDTTMLASDIVKLSNGNNVQRYTLSNQFLSVSLIPELGGKITSIKTPQGREFLSRSDRPYAMRRYGMKFAETEFDGIDECFPSVADSTYPAGPWNDRPIPDHGELCQLAWAVTAQSSNSIETQAHGKGFPYVFTRTLSVDGNSIHLDYQLENLSANPFHCSYAFHPLFAGETGCAIEMPDETIIHLELSAKNYLGAKGTTASWGSYLDLEGNLFKEQQFDADSQRYYKYYTEALKTGHLRLSYPDGYGVSMTWPAKLFPYLAVWCSQGAVGGLQHIAPEPTNTVHDALADAYQQKQHLTLNGNGHMHWRISLKVEEPLAQPEAEVEVETEVKPSTETKLAPEVSKTSSNTETTTDPKAAKSSANPEKSLEIDHQSKTGNTVDQETASP